jgi:hypothetical protein
VQRPSTTKQRDGSTLANWDNPTTVLRAYASIQPIRSGPYAAYVRRDIRSTHNVFFAQSVSAVEGDRISYGSRTFVITAGPIDAHEHGELVQLEAQEIL